jgi:hypothetical protein
MPGTVDLVVFGIEARVRLGRTIMEIQAEEIRNRDLVFPLAESAGLFTFEGVLTFGTQATGP